MSWWLLEAMQVVVLIVLAVALQRVIRRSGEAYSAELFGGAPALGRAFLVLADIAFYLIFAAYTLFNVQFRSETPRVDAGQVEEVLYSAAGIALVIGVLHLLNIVVLPMVASVAARGRGVPAAAGSEAGALEAKVGSVLLRVTLAGE